MDSARVRAEFEKRFPEAGTPFLCRIPGRINLLGEHLDYNGLPVLPMAINRDIVLAFAGRQSPEIVLENMDARFPTARFANGARLTPSATGAWDNYCKAAVQGLNAHFERDVYPGMDILVDSDLPLAAGLSSSSALVVGFALAYLATAGYTLGQDISRRDLARVLANAEHYVGTAGGGMDQSILLNAHAGNLTKINFIPFQFEHLPLPDNAVVLVCDSMVASEKSGNTLHKYNAGPAACSLITNMLNVHFVRTFGEDFSIDCLGDLWLGPLCFNRSEVEALFAEVLAKPYMTHREIVRYLGMNPRLIQEYWLESLPEGPEGLPLQARARHVVSEYYRVEEARDALIAGDLPLVGRLMNDSHRSCATDYGISTPELDQLAALLVESGCLGARLTGAGFGGAVIGLIEVERSETAVAAIKHKYYREFLGYTGDCPIFVTNACAEANYI